jgi:hypothetical protein
MKSSLKFYLTLLVIIILNSCSKYNDHYHSLEDISSKEYYSSDILPDSLQNLYGRWNLIATSGGYSGSGNGKEFDYLVFKKNGIFGVIKNEILIAYGKLTLKHDIHTTYLNFVSIKSANIDLCTDPVKDINFINKDTLNLNAPCCDRFNIHLVRNNP